MFYLLVGPVLAGNDNLDSIKERMLPFTTLKGSFEQSKQIRLIKKPLRSQGEFTLLKDKGVLWRTIEPTTSLLRITHDEIVQIKDGKTTVLVSLKQNPALGLIGKILFAVFSADIEELKRNFEFTRDDLNRQTGHWEASLLPKDPMVRKVIDHIDLSGGRTLETLRLYEVNGDKTSIIFTRVSQNRHLSKKEGALFE